MTGFAVFENKEYAVKVTERLYDTLSIENEVLFPDYRAFQVAAGLENIQVLHGDSDILNCSFDAEKFERV